MPFVLQETGSARVEKGRSVGIKNYRPMGQAKNRTETQLMVVLMHSDSYPLVYLPTIPGELPKNAYVFSTTAAEKGLTLGRTS